MDKYKSLLRMCELLDISDRLYRILWAVVTVVGTGVVLFGTAALLTAIARLNS